VWHAVLDELAQVLTSENFNTWLAGKALQALQALQALDDERLHERAERVTRIAYVVGVA